MKGIIMAGGFGSRLHPLTLGVSKQLLPVYDKPMIYYPLSVLMLAGIQEVLIITTPEDQPSFQRILGNGSQFGMQFEFSQQATPRGLGEAFVIGESFIGGDSVTLVLGDNIFYGQAFSPRLRQAVKRAEERNEATIFGYQVKDPERFGVVEFNREKKAISIEEKPIHPRSPYAVTGLYFYDNSVIEIAKRQSPSARGELEITDINNEYLGQSRLYVENLGRGFAWLDTGTHDSLMQAAQFVETIEKRQGFKIACLEEIAMTNLWISAEKVINAANSMGDNDYSRYLKEIAQAS